MTSAATLPATMKALLDVAAALNDASADELAGLFAAAREQGVPPAWLEELVLHSVLLVGYPRALQAAGALRRVMPEIVEVGDAADYTAWPAWQERAEATCRKIYGTTYDQLVKNLGALHPALLASVMIDGYGRIISRPGLEMKLRELCTIAALVAQGAPAQLHSHLRGAHRQGATPDEITAAIEIAAARPRTAPELANAARAQWNDLRSRIR